MVVVVALGANPVLRDGNALPVLRFLAGSAVMKSDDEVVACAQAVGPRPAFLCARRQSLQMTKLQNDEARCGLSRIPEGGTATPTRCLMLAMSDDSRGVPRLNAAPKNGMLGSIWYI
jgi:hypothetical protein